MGKGFYTGALPTVPAKKPPRRSGSMKELNRRLGEWLNTHTMHTLSKPALQILLGFHIRGRWDTCQWRCGHKAIATQYGAALHKKNGVILGVKGGVDHRRISIGFKELIRKGVVIVIKKRQGIESATYELTDPAKVPQGLYNHEQGAILSRTGGYTVTPLTNVLTSIYKGTPLNGGAPTPQESAAPHD
jgi:hypothetical protein